MMGSLVSGNLSTSRHCSSVQTEYKRLVKEALDAKKRAYAPYSRFHVGAALLTTSGKIYQGCNIEISTYALTICAERTAIFKAISEGDKDFKAIAVVSDDPGYTPPCGACRQVLMDLAGNIDFLMINGKGSVKILKMRDLLPHAFGQKNLERTRKTHR
jgi:cytidine deaminase